MTVKTCSTCEEEKVEDEFAVRADTGKRHGRCRTCLSYYHKFKHIKNKYGLTPEEYQRMYEAVDGICPLCMRRPVGATDHDHDTGEVRGLLCVPCNAWLRAVDDDPETIFRVAAYLNLPPTL